MEKKFNDLSIAALNAFAEAIGAVQAITGDVAKTRLEDVTAQMGMKSGQVLQALRVAITGDASGPDLMLSIEILGGTESAARIREVIAARAQKVV